MVKQFPGYFVIYENDFYFCTHESNIPSVKGVWFLLRRAERLGSEKPWQPIRQAGLSARGSRCQNLIPGCREMIKMNTGHYENNLSGQERTSNTTDAYVHAPVITRGIIILKFLNHSFLLKPDLSGMNPYINNNYTDHGNK